MRNSGKWSRRREGDGSEDEDDPARKGPGVLERLRRVIGGHGRRHAADGGRDSLREWFDFAIYSAGMSAWEWDLAADQITIRSVGGCLLGYGCPPSSQTYAQWLDRVHPGDRAEVARSLEEHLDGKTGEWRCEHRFAHAAGGWLWVCNQGVVRRRGKDGRALWMLGMTRDIDSFKRTQKELEIQRDLFREAGRIAKMIAWEYRPAEDACWWLGEEVFVREWFGKGCANLEAFIQSFEQADAAILREAFCAAMEKGEDFDVDVDVVGGRAARSIRLRVVGSPQRDADTGEIRRVIGFCRDITERSRLENERRALFELSPDLLGTVEPSGRLSHYNPSWLSVLGYSPEELGSKGLQELIVPEDREAFVSSLNQVEEGRPVLQKEMRILDRRGNERWFSLSLYGERRPGNAFIAAREMTEIRERQRELEAARKKAEAANRAKSEFLAVMSHELRTPLNPIHGFASLLLEELEAEEHKEILHLILKSGEDLTMMIDDILDFSRMEAGDVALKDQRFSLHTILREESEAGARKAQAKHLTIRSSFDPGPEPDEPEMIGDVTKIRSILRKLLGNAIKFTESGRVELRGRIRGVREATLDVEIEVEDTGIGIAREHMDKLFQPFSQVDSSMSRPFGGSGLGLSICQRLAEALGGDISVESVVNQGSVFHVRMPLQRFVPDSPAENEEALPVAAERKASELHGPTVAGARILLIEDNEANILALRRILESMDCRVTLARTGEEALERFRPGEYDLVLLDLHLPGKDGGEVVKELRGKEEETPNFTPVVVLTADARDGVREDCMRLGATDLLVKPVRKAEVRDLLDRFVFSIPPGGS